MTEPDAKRPRAMKDKQYITYILPKFEELKCTSLQAYLASRRIKDFGEFTISFAKSIATEFADIQVLSTTIDEIVQMYFDDDDDYDDGERAEKFCAFMSNLSDDPLSERRYGELKRIVELIHEFADRHKDIFGAKLKDQEVLHDVLGEMTKTGLVDGLWTIERSCREACAKTGDMYWHELADKLVRAVYELTN